MPFLGSLVGEPPSTRLHGAEPSSSVVQVGFRGSMTKFSEVRPCHHVSVCAGQNANKAPTIVNKTVQPSARVNVSLTQLSVDGLRVTSQAIFYTSRGSEDEPLIPSPDPGRRWATEAAQIWIRR